MSIVAGARFNPASKADAGKAHLLRIREGACAGLPAGNSAVACWESAAELNDSMLAGLVQLLSLEHDMEVDCVLAAGYRLPQEICLNLPSQKEDPTAHSVKVLYEALQHSNAAASIQVVCPRCCVSGCRLDKRACLRQAPHARGCPRSLCKRHPAGVLTSVSLAQAVGGGSPLPDLAGSLEKLRPACALTVGEFAPIQPDSAAAFYK